MGDKTRNLEWRQRDNIDRGSDLVDDVTAATTDTVPITHPYVQVDSTAGAVTTYTLPDGKPGQILVIDLQTDGGNVDVVPTTATGWSAIALDDAGDKAILMYANDTAGWIILGLVGAAAAPLFTAA